MYLIYLIDIYYFIFSSAEEENLRVAPVTNTSGEKWRFTVSPDGVWEQAVGLCSLLEVTVVCLNAPCNQPALSNPI